MEVLFFEIKSLRRQGRRRNGVVKKLSHRENENDDDNFLIILPISRRLDVVQEEETLSSISGVFSLFRNEEKNEKRKVFSFCSERNKVGRLQFWKTY